VTSGSPTGRALNQPCSGAPTQRCCTVTAFGEFLVKIFCISTRTTSSTTSLGSVALGKGKLDSESFEHMTSALLSVHRVPPGNCWTKCSEMCAPSTTLLLPVGKLASSSLLCSPQRARKFLRTRTCTFMPVLGWWSAISFRWEVPLRLLGGALSLTHPRRACSGCRAGSSDSSAATANRFGHCRCCRAGSIDSSAATTNRFGHCRCCLLQQTGLVTAGAAVLAALTAALLQQTGLVTLQTLAHLTRRKTHPWYL
jgi:hypothetical protein